MKGALNLHVANAGEPNWKDYDGLRDLAFSDHTVFSDVRKDGTDNGEYKNEKPQGLNLALVQVSNFTTNPGITAEALNLFASSGDIYKKTFSNLRYCHIKVVILAPIDNRHHRRSQLQYYNYDIRTNS